MTYPLQFAAGALINTAGSGNDFVGGTNGYGNVQFNGLPALSNGYIVDGLETNDPLTNLNSGLSTNLVLGLNSIAEVTVNTLSYAVDQGRYGASQVNYVTKSGTNQFHGNLYELWNGSRFNAADFFTNATPGNHKPRSTVNHFGGSLGGPIRARQAVLLLRLANGCGSRCRSSRPPPCRRRRFRTTSCSNCRCGGVDSVTGSTYQPAPQLVPFYQKMFSLYGNTAGTPLRGSGLSVQQRWQRGGGQSAEWKRLRESAERFAFERRSRAGADGAHRLQHRCEQHGLVPLSGRHRACRPPTPTRSIRCSTPSRRSRCTRSRPATRTCFRRHLVNYFNPAFSWYESLFGPADLAEDAGGVSDRARRAAAPTRRSPRSAGWTTPGCRDGAPRASSSTTIWPGRRARMNCGSEPTRRIFRLNDYDFGEGAVPLVTYTTLPQFIYGVASTASETFPLADSQPYNFLNLDLYAQDTWKVTRTLTWTFGVRDTYNSNPLNPHDAVARLAGSFDSISHDVNQPLNAGDPDAAREHLRFDAAGDSAAAERRSHGRSRRTRCCAADSVCSATFCPAAWSIWWA